MTKKQSFISSDSIYENKNRISGIVKIVIITVALVIIIIVFIVVIDVVIAVVKVILIPTLKAPSSTNLS